jgi:hypothetical protein
MRILIRTSKLAIWARRFGSFALPLAIVPVFMHRERMLPSSDFQLIELVAIGVAALGLCLALAAFARLWVTGDLGWSKAVTGLLLSLIVLVPAGFLLSLMLRYPAISDVTTDFARPPGLVSQSEAEPVTAAWRPAIEATFPNARNRSYPIEAGQMYSLVASLVGDRGWELRARREPQTPLAEGQINSIATTLLGWRDEVAIRVTGNAAGTTVAMRSTALHASPDFGENGRRVEEFLTALDQRVTEMLRNAPLAPAEPEEPAAEAEAPAESEG